MANQLIKWAHFVKSHLIWFLVITVTTTLTNFSGYAHGTSSGSKSDGLALIIFPLAIVLFALFLVFTHRKKGWTVLVTGGAGYVGSALVPKLLQHGHRVVVLDLFPYEKDVFKKYEEHENFQKVSGDFTDQTILVNALRGCDAVIHLGCVTGRTGLKPGSPLAKATNLVAFEPLVNTAKSAGIKRFILASSLQEKCQGARQSPENGRLQLDETKEFHMHKERCEKVLKNAKSPGFVVCAVRAPTVCGVAPSQRLDFGINALACSGYKNRVIRILGSEQQKVGSIHIEDLSAFFLHVLNQPDARIDGKIFAANPEKLTLREISAEIVAALGKDVSLQFEHVDEYKNLEFNYDEIDQEFDFEVKHSVVEALRSLIVSFQETIDVPHHNKLSHTVSNLMQPKSKI